MLRIPPINLNKQAQEATVLLIREVLDKGITLSEVGFLQVFLALTLKSSGLRRRVRSDERSRGISIKPISWHKVHR